MSVNTTDDQTETNTSETQANVNSDAPRQHVEEGEISNGGLDLPAGEPKSDEKEAAREAHHEWHPETGNQ